MPCTTNGSTFIPGLRYRDAHAAIDFLCAAFGFPACGLRKRAHKKPAASRLLARNIRPESDRS